MSIEDQEDVADTIKEDTPVDDDREIRDRQQTTPIVISADILKDDHTPVENALR
jgi:hypothetical protein